MTRDIPILFSAPMVRAILEGRKTQTRRLVHCVPDAPDANCHPSHKQKHPAPYLDAYCSDEKTALNPRGMSDRWCWWQVDDRQCLPTFKVRWRVGDRLWVRETWSGHHLFRDTKPAERRSFVGDGWPYLREDVWYWADGNPTAGDYERPRPSIHMPRWASRITLLVTDVRVQRLQDISEADARAEGAPPWTGSHQSYVTGFYNIWAAINGPGSWDANPWVAAISFERVT